MILFQSRDIAHRIVKALRKSGIHSTTMYPSILLLPNSFETCIRTSIRKATIGVRRRRCVKQVGRFWGNEVTSSNRKPTPREFRGDPGGARSA